MKRMPPSSEKMREALRIFLKGAQMGATLVRSSIPVVSAIAVVIREIRRHRR